MSADMASVFRSAWFKIGAALVGAIIIGFALYYGHQYYLGRSLSEKLPEGGTKVVFSDRGMAETFEMTEFSFSEIPPEVVGGVTILEAKDVPNVSGTSIVIGKKAGVEGTILGIRTGSEIETLLSDGTNKSDLLVTEEGIAVFAVAARPAFFPEEIAPQESSEEVDTSDSTEPDVIGVAEESAVSALKPDTGETFSAQASVFAFDLNTKKLRPLGSGKSPRVSQFGTIIAIGSEGVVDIDPVSGSRMTLITYRGGDAPGSALSTDGSIAALRRDGSSTVEFFRVTDDRGVYLGQIFSASPMYGTAILGERHIFVRTGKDTVSLYALTDDPSAVQPHFAELGILLPN